MTPVRAVLVGVGDIGARAHLPALVASRDVRLVGLVDRDLDRCAAAAPAIPATRSLEDALSRWEVDAVVLATPPCFTPQLAVAALVDGRFVLAEKPIAVSSAAAEPLIALEPSERARLQVGFTYRHHPALEQLREWVAAGSLGKPLLVRVHVYDERIDPGDPAHSRRVEAALREGTPLLHDGAHVFDWLSLLFGLELPEIEDAWLLSTDEALPAPNLTGARLRYADGTRVLLEVGWWLPAFPASCLELVGPGGRARLNLEDFAIDAIVEGRPRRIASAGEWGEQSFKRQLERFVELCRSHRPPEPGLEEALASLRLSEQIQTAAGFARTEALRS